MVCVQGVEIGRTDTIPNSSDPLWAARFRLLSSELLGRGPATAAASRRVNGQREALPGPASSSLPPPPLESLSSVVLEVWDSVSEGGPIMLGAAELPSDILRALLSWSLDCDDDCHDDHDDSDAAADDDVDGKSKGSRSRSAIRSRKFHSFDLRLGPVPPKKQGLVSTSEKNDGHDDETRATSAGTVGIPGRPTTSGTLSVSLERVSPEKKVVLAIDSTSAGGEEQDHEGMTLPDEDISHALSEAKDQDDVEKGMSGMTTGATSSEVCIYSHEYPRRKGCSLRSLGILFCYVQFS